jgi:general secretion pathway protein I
VIRHVMPQQLGPVPRSSWPSVSNDHLPFANYSSRERGFTLLEVMVSVAILALALPLLLGLRNWDVLAREQAQLLTVAAMLGQEKLFEAEQLGFLPVGEQNGDFLSNPPGFPVTGELKDRAPGFRWTRTVSPTPFDMIREIRIRISWPRGTREDSLDVTGYAFQDPAQAAAGK